MGAQLEIAALDGSGSFNAYLAGPADGTVGIIVIQEIFGINAGIRSMVEGWAALGYRAAAPDLFWRAQPGIELDPDVPDEMQRAFSLYGAFDADKGVADIEATIKKLRGLGCQKIGVVGYCLGGYLAYLTATRTDSDATVGYYGVGIDGKLNEAHAIAKPFLLHIASKDGFVPAAAQAAVHGALDDHDRVTIFDYPADHAFARAVGSSRVPALAEQADARTKEFFAANLR